MHESLIGRHWFNASQALLLSSTGGQAADGPDYEAILRAAQIHGKARDLDHMIAGLSFRLSLACPFLRSLSWPDNEQWSVAIGLEDGLTEFSVPGGASVPHALADLSLVVATLISRGHKMIERDHRSFKTAAIGIADPLCWEDGAVTLRGIEVDSLYSSGLFGFDRQQAS